MFFGYRLNWVESLTVDAMLTVIWMVGVTNAFNLLDNMDGLSAGIAVIAAAAFLDRLLPTCGERRPARRYLALLMGSLLGFLLLQLPSRVDLHGRQRQPVHRHERVATLTLENAPDSRAGPGCCRSSAGRSWSC